MVDYEKIGRRITEQRKHLRKISQEKMAEDLGMYQADISNLEKAKRGSGITDLYKLDLIADYFEIPLETLLFGKGNQVMEKYYGDKMQIKVSKKKVPKEHQDILTKLVGVDTSELPVDAFECGPYKLYVFREIQALWGEGKKEISEDTIDMKLMRIHVYVFWSGEVVSTLVADVTNIWQHIIQPQLKNLQLIINSDILDVTDVLRTINPYWALWQFEENDVEKEKSFQLMCQRMDELKPFGNTTVLYIESVYVREDFRQKGILRMLIDFLKKTCGDCVMWLNMEPTTGVELTSEFGHIPAYTVSELGQVSMNASIAERLGFTVDSDTWHRQAEVIGSTGEISTQIIEIRKCAYYIPNEICQVLKDDKDLVSIGRAKQRLLQKEENGSVIDMRSGIKDGFKILEIKESIVSGSDRGKTVFVYASHSIDEDQRFQFGVSYRSVLDNPIGHDGQLEVYEYLDDADESIYYDRLVLLNTALLLI